MREIAARICGVSKCYGDVVALGGVDLEIEQGQVHALVGPNGAGKTTLLGLLLGLSTPDAGTIELFGRRVRSSLDAPEGVGGFVDGPGLYPSLTARQNLAAVARLRGIRSDVQAALRQVGLAAVADERVRGFSLGMRQRLGLAAALLASPRLLVLDEPSNGLDPAGKHHVHRVIRDLAVSGVAVVISSHRMDDLEALCQQVTVLNAGRAVFSGSLAKLAAQNGAVEYRLATADAVRARCIAQSVPGVAVAAGTEDDPDGPLIVHGAAPALDELVMRLVHQGLPIREFAPVISPLESAFLALTDDEETAV